MRACITEAESKEKHSKHQKKGFFFHFILGPVLSVFPSGRVKRLENLGSRRYLTSDQVESGVLQRRSSDLLFQISTHNPLFLSSFLFRATNHHIHTAQSSYNVSRSITAVVTAWIRKQTLILHLSRRRSFDLMFDRSFFAGRASNRAPRA